MDANAFIGTSVGPWKLHHALGSGRIGLVFEGRHVQTENRVAVKVVAPATVGSPRSLALFLSSFRQVAEDENQLTHPHILPLLEYGVQDGYGYLVTPFAASGTLRMFMGRTDPLSPSDVQALLTPITDALSYAHTLGIVHGSITPANILFTDAGHVQLTDFGQTSLAIPWSARPIRSGYEETVSLTSTMLTYLAPEQLREQESDQRTDTYALGMLLYELLTGTTPYSGHAATELIDHLLHTPPSPPRLLRQDLNPAIEQFLLHAISKRPKERYASVQELVEAWKIVSLAGQTEQPDKSTLYDVAALSLELSEETHTDDSREVKGEYLQHQNLCEGAMLPQFSKPPFDSSRDTPIIHGEEKLLPGTLGVVPLQAQESESALLRSALSTSSRNTDAVMTLASNKASVETSSIIPADSVSDKNRSPIRRISTTHLVEQNTSDRSRAVFSPPSLQQRASANLLTPAAQGAGTSHVRQRHSPSNTASERWGHLLSRGWRALLLSFVVLLLGAGTLFLLPTQRSQLPGGTTQNGGMRDAFFSDQLVRAQNLWPTQPTGTYAFRGGAYHLSDHDTSDVQAVLLNGPWITDAIYSLTMYEVKGNDQDTRGSFGMMLRCNSESETGQMQAFYSFEGTTSPGGFYQFYKYDARQYDARRNGESAAWTLLWQRPIGSEFHRGLGSSFSNRLSVEATASTFTLSVNGVTVGTLHDTSFSAGAVGMLVHDAGTEVAFSQLTLGEPTQGNSQRNARSLLTPTKLDSSVPARGPYINNGRKNGGLV